MTPPRGATWSRRISTDSPISIAPSSAPSISSVRWARRARGGRKAGTPLAMASIPVRAEQPAEKAFRIRITPTASVMRTGCAVPTTAAGCERTRPTMMTPKIEARNTTIGSMRTRALSAMPHRLTAVIKTRPVRDITSRWWASDGNAEARLAAPAARLTATVST